MKSFSFKILIIFQVLILWAGSGAAADKKFPVSQLRSDFSLFRQVLKEAHPGLYRYNTKEQIDSLFLQSGRQINRPMTQQEFYQLMLPVVGRLKCGHTKLHPETNWSDHFFWGSDKVFPLRLHIQDQRAYVLGSYDDMIRVPAAAEVMTINNRPMAGIIDTLLTGFFSDGNNTSFKYIEMGKFFSAHYANRIQSPDSFVITLRKGRELTDITLPAIGRAKIDHYEEQLAAQQPAREPYAMEFISDSVAKLTIFSFWRESKGLSYRRFLKRSFAQINRKGIRHLIIDIRDNEGGKDKRGALLLSYLMDRKFSYYDRMEAATNKRYSFARQAILPRFYGILRMLIAQTHSGAYVWPYSKNLKVQKPQKHPYTQNVYVLTNGASFSVSAEFAAVTHYLKRATFIGQETGGGYYGNNSGTFVIVTLPNSRLVMGIPLLAYYTAVKDYPFTDRGLIPDYEVKPAVTDILDGNDVALDFTLKLVNKNWKQREGRGETVKK